MVGRSSRVTSALLVNINIFAGRMNMNDIEAFKEARRADALAVILAIDTAIPPNPIEQSSYPDYYFRITNNEHKADLKDKLKHMYNGVCVFFYGSSQTRQGGGYQGHQRMGSTHLLFCTTSDVGMPGADYQLTKLLDLRPSVKRVSVMMYQQGCFASDTVLRVAKFLVV
ncbi:hypothetical protein KI387_026419 [Taxus chinensis]|uniref:Chalcone/stilbene synthase N-terminal domain-containing protein n=1 Tax=Taxus chinensis TaxID=29808 RepID=A0AA38FYR6_TAXCH|nr:hypothetical protein KI387_026419 [Taxus chinensis]